MVMENNSDSKQFVFYTDKVKYWVEQKGGKKRYFVAGHISTSDPLLSARTTISIRQGILLHPYHALRRI